MSIPGYKLKWYSNPAFGAFLADIAIAVSAALAAAMAFRARGGSVFGAGGATAGLALGAALTKAVLTWREKGHTHGHHGLVGCLHTLDSVLRASSEENIDHGLRLTIHVPVDEGHGKTLEQVVDYVSVDGRLRTGAGRRFMPQCGILGKAYRLQKPLIAVREQMHLDSSRPNYFTANRVGLVGNACVGIALFIGRQYTKP